MAFSCIGFLPCNIPNAKIFMGDVGSILLGSVFGGIVYMTSNSIIEFACMASFLFPFYADELSTMVIRLKDGENLTTAHRKHVYQLLANEYQIAHWKVSIWYGVVQLLVGVGAMMAKPFGLMAVLTVIVSTFVLFVTGGYIIRAGLKRNM